MSPLRTPLLLLVLLVAALPLFTFAQGVDCTVNVNYESVGNANKDLLNSFASDLRDYLNNYQWGADNYPDKITCTIDVFIQGVTGENKYMAQVFIGSQRPIFNSNQSTAVVRLKDDAWEFTYVKGRPITHSPYTFSDLTSFLDFYMYLIVGLDGDTYERGGGTRFLQKAADISRMGSSTSVKGWQALTSGYSRSQYINELLLPTCEPLRAASFLYHFAGLDSLAIDQARGLANMHRAITLVDKAQRGIGPRSLAIKVFFDTKYKELGEVFATYPDKSIYDLLCTLDPGHISTYAEAKKGH